MSNKKKMRDLGTTLSCLGGLLVTLNMTSFKDSEWGLALAIAAVVLALTGVIIISKNKES